MHQREKAHKRFERTICVSRKCKGAAQSSREMLIIMRDLNAKVGKEKEGKGYNVIGKHGMGKRNEKGERFIQWCEDNNLIITHTWYKQHPRRLWRWISP